MNELFNLKAVDIAGHQIRAVDARELHTFLEVGRDFPTWIKDRIEQGLFAEGKDYVVFPGIGENLRGGRPTKEYGLSISMAKELSMLERNEQGKLARQYFIECETRLAAVAPEQYQIAVTNWRKNRVNACYFQKLMGAALHLSRARQGKDTTANHYTNEANMLYKLLLGANAKKWMTDNGFTGELRQHLSVEQLELLAYLEHTNATFLEMDWSYEQRKEKLAELFTRHLLEKTA
jgi:phage anti-repressor protein